jgi:hypothetical protein
MVRKKLTLDEKIGLAEVAAWQAHGKANRGWFVGLTYAKILLPIVLIVAPIVLLVWWIVRTLGSLSAPSMPDSAGPWPWVLLAISGSTAAALTAYRWASPFRGGRPLIAAIVACLLISALAIVWGRAAA